MLRLCSFAGTSLLLVCLVGCAVTKVTFAKGEITANASGVKAAQEVKADGTTIHSIDTNEQTWWDTLKATVKGFGRSLGSMLSRTTPEVQVN